MKEWRDWWSARRDTFKKRWGERNGDKSTKPRAVPMNRERSQRFVMAVVQKLVTVSSRGLPEPGHNRFTPQAMGQGFSWRRGNVSFEVLEDAGDVPFEVALADTLQVSPRAFRALVVPFEVAAGGIELCDMSYGSVHPFDLPEGSYALLFEMEFRERTSGLESSEDTPVCCRVTFVPSQDVAPAILKQDAGLRPSKRLVLDGQLA
ncbi:competence protein ComJ [Corallococcus sp. AS-1-6]|uniref:competence protein ComJ n=1 Tax=Corallococcus sp. AS-1-6 TaxID=2874599 RepID=UPI001CBEFC09|nr:competence protein ComJ [Corallococcus sp. AS-1-6]